MRFPPLEIAAPFSPLSPTSMLSPTSLVLLAAGTASAWTAGAGTWQRAPMPAHPHGRRPLRLTPYPVLRAQRFRAPRVLRCFAAAR